MTYPGREADMALIAKLIADSWRNDPEVMGEEPEPDATTDTEDVAMTVTWDTHAGRTPVPGHYTGGAGSPRRQTRPTITPLSLRFPPRDF